jgi:hypothetical protein
MQRKTNNRFVSMALALLVLAMMTPFFSTPQIVFAKDSGDTPRLTGWVQAKPASGFVGTWKVGGKTFQATSGTQIDQADGQLRVGACAKVKYQVVNGQNRAIEIDSEPARDCR